MLAFFINLAKNGGVTARVRVSVRVRDLGSFMYLLQQILFSFLEVSGVDV